MVGGYTGKILRVDLSTSKILLEPLDMNLARKYIGGKGVGAKYLFDELKKNVDALSADNILILMNGPLTGTLAPCFSRYVVVTKSPLTNAFLDSYAGGYFGAELKFAGLDGVIITGRAESPSYLLIQDEKAEIKSAENIWGKDVHATEKIIREEIDDKDAKVAAIGPAGENLAKIACITNDLYRHAGRGGSGAVMGSKNLKAVAVKGTKDVEVPNIDSFIELCKNVIKEDVLANVENEMMIVDGTPALVGFCQMAGILPTRNFQSGVFERADEIDVISLKNKILARRKACFGCPIACSNFTKVPNGPYRNTSVDGPDYETIALAGSNCSIDSIEAIAKFNLLCDQLGLDTMSAGDVVAFAMECYERGLLSKKDTGGLELTFGNIDAYIKMPELIALRKGIGDVLADGAKKAAERIGKGAERFVLHVKGLEYPGYDPRGSIGMALAYATSDRGACHLRAWPANVEAWGPLDPFLPDGKADLVIKDQDRNSVKWSLIGCDFYAVRYPIMAKLYSAATGYEVDEKELKIIGERIWNLTRAFNVREGLSRKDDTIPPRITEDPLPEGKTKGHIVSKEDFERMLNEYYDLRGWSKEGIPTKAKLEELGVAQALSNPIVKH